MARNKDEVIQHSTIVGNSTFSVIFHKYKTRPMHVINWEEIIAIECIYMFQLYMPYMKILQLPTVFTSSLKSMYQLKFLLRSIRKEMEKL